MTAKEINAKALNFLDKQEWKKAQDLFFKNAKENPSHQTYNNLGFFLIIEGLICSNGKVRNALKLGNKYLFKARQFKITTVNTLAIITSFDRMLRSEKEDKALLYASACEVLKDSLKREYFVQIHYNLLRFLYLSQPQNKLLLEETEKLLNRFVCQESVFLNLCVLSQNNMIDKMKKQLSKHAELLDEYDRFAFYLKAQMYEEAYALCKNIYQSYEIDYFIRCAISECYIKTGRKKELTSIIKLTDDFYTKNNVSGYREKVIKNYQFIPPILESCAYFGCDMHNVKWD